MTNWKLLLVVALALGAKLQAAHAATVQCDGVDGEVRFEITIEKVEIETPKGNHFKQAATSMRVSDPNLSQAHSEIALFESREGLLSSASDVVIGYVDENNPKTGRRGERIGGTTLGQLRSVMVKFDRSLDEIVTATRRHAGEARYLKKFGEELTQDLDCVRQK